MRLGLRAAVMLLVAASPLGVGKADDGAKKLVEPKIETVLDWLPADTESLIVANGAIEIPDKEGFAAIGKLRQLEDAMHRMACGELLEIGDGQFRKILRGRVVSLAVSSARKFRAPKQLGAAPYEGCNCLILRRDLGEHALILKEALQKNAKAQKKIAGIDVYQFEEKREQDLWKFLVAIPRPNVLVCATDRGYLIELLNRMDSPKALRPRAFPEELPLWKQVDLKARFWALHHYRKSGKDFKRLVRD